MLSVIGKDGRHLSTRAMAIVEMSSMRFSDEIGVEISSDFVVFNWEVYGKRWAAA